MNSAASCYALGNPYGGGIRRAVDEYFSSAAERPVVFGDKSGTAMLRKAVRNYTGVFANNDQG